MVPASASRSTVARPRALHLAVLALLATALVPVSLAHGVADAGGAPGVVVRAASVDRQLLTYGAARSAGAGNDRLGARNPVVAMAATPFGRGYWLLDRAGEVVARGSARRFATSPHRPIRGRFVAIAATPTGKGYWRVTDRGEITRAGDAKPYGSLVGLALAAPVVAITPTPTGEGYWLATADGGVFTFGDARFKGSLGGRALPGPVVGMMTTVSGQGYALAMANGSIAFFGDARNRGDASRRGGRYAGIARTPGGFGYWMVRTDGTVVAFGAAARYSGPPVTPDRAVVALVANPSEEGLWVLAPRQDPAATIAGVGACGDTVRSMQRRLLDLGYWLDGVDGCFGAITQQAVWAFQKANLLARTGVLDVRTWYFMRRVGRTTPRSTSGFVAEVDKARQIVILANDGRATWVLNTSTGTEKPYVWKGETYMADTPPGRWRVTSQVDGWKDGELGRLYRPKYFHPDGIAFHGYSSVPPYPASHGCVRLTNAAIDWVWNTGQIPLGSPVWVY